MANYKEKKGVSLGGQVDKGAKEMIESQKSVEDRLGHEGYLPQGPGEGGKGFDPEGGTTRWRKKAKYEGGKGFKPREAYPHEDEMQQAKENRKYKGGKGIKNPRKNQRKYHHNTYTEGE